MKYGMPVENVPCQVCGGEPGWCACPECPVCRETGNIFCYGEHMDEMPIAAAIARWNHLAACQQSEHEEESYLDELLSSVFS